MFSYTDDAIVTSSPTGRHLSTVIRHPAGMPDDQWRKHADQVCTVLNELDSKAKASSLSLHLQTVGRVSRVAVEDYDLSSCATTARQFAQRADGPSFEDLYVQGYLTPWSRKPLATEARQPMPSADPQREENLELRRKLNDATTKLCAAQMLLEKPVRLTADDVLRVLNLPIDTAIDVDGRTLARVEQPAMTRFEQFQQNVQRWATERGIYEHSTALAQALKAVSEVGELCDAVIKHQRAEAQDAVGDVAVCVVNVAHFLSHTFDPDHFDPENLLRHDHFRAAAEAARVVGTLSHQVATMCNMMEAFVNDGCDRAITALREFCVCRGLDFDDCCESAWQTIKDRKGRMVAGGAFVKEGE